MLVVNQVLGLVTDQGLSDQVHDISHHGTVEKVILNTEDISRHRLKVKTNLGREIAIQLPRQTHLQNGAVLHLTDEHVVWVEVSTPEYLRLKPIDVATALELGYFAGNMHWQIKFDADCIEILMQSGKAHYLERLAHFFEKQVVSIAS